MSVIDTGKDGLKFSRKGANGGLEKNANLPNLRLRIHFPDKPYFLHSAKPIEFIKIKIVMFYCQFTY